MRYAIVIEEGEQNFGAYVPDLPGCVAVGESEEEVRRRGCEQVALSTHSFQAPRFYARRGYVECGRTPAYPRGHDQIHLVKRLG